MNHFATPGFWFHYQQLPTEIQELANKNSQSYSRIRIIRRCG